MSPTILTISPRITRQAASTTRPELKVAIGTWPGVVRVSAPLVPVDTVVLAAQQSDGTWGLQPRTVAFDGEARAATPDASHTVAHALFVLRRFLDTSATKP